MKRKKSRQSSSKLTQDRLSEPPLLPPCAAAAAGATPAAAPLALGPLVLVPASTFCASSRMCRGDRHPTASQGAMLLAKVLPHAAPLRFSPLLPLWACVPRKVRSCLSPSVSPANRNHDIASFRQ